MGYLRSMGPGIIVVLTWLGAGDIVSAGVSGGNHGYALMWVMVLAVLVRFVFVSLIARYQLCNPRGETVVDGLARLHPWFAPFLLFSAFVLGHVLGAFTLKGCGEAWAGLTGVGDTWQWTLVWIIAALGLVFRPEYTRIERTFKVLLGLFAVSILGTAMWTGPDPAGIVRGTLAFALPPRSGPFDSGLIAVSMLGAVVGSLMNLAYPYFLDLKGWRGPEYRRVQQYDLLLSVVVMAVLNLAVWTLGAELVHSHGQSVENLNDLTMLLSVAIGEWGRRLFLLGVFAAVFTSLVGGTMVLAFLASHSHLRWAAGSGEIQRDFRTTKVYRFMIIWSLVSPFYWSLPDMPDFVALTLIGNSLQVLIVPLLAGGLWWITASEQFIGRKYRNRWWENAFMLGVVLLACYSSIELVRKLVLQVIELVQKSAG